MALDSPGTYGSGGEYFLEIKRSNNDATVVRNICQPQAVIHPTTGYIYLFSPDIGVNPGDKSDIFYCVSTTSGSSWSAKQKVNDDITVNTANDQWNLAVAIRSTGAQLFVGYYDRQTDGNNGFVEVRGRVGDISGSIVSFRRSITIAPARFEIIDVGLEGDYNTAVGDGSFAYFVWGDNRNRASGTTFYEANIRFAKIKFP